MAADDGLTDLVLTELQRSGTDGATQGELQEAVGLGPGDCSAALAALRDVGAIGVRVRGGETRWFPMNGLGEPIEPGDVVEAEIEQDQRYLVAYPGGSHWTDAESPEEAANQFGLSEHVAEMGAGEEVYVIKSDCVVTFSARVSLVREEE